MKEHFEMVDTRWDAWPVALRDAIEARRPVILVLPGRPEASSLLEDLLQIRMDGEAPRPDRIILYDLSRRLSAPQYLALLEAQAQDRFVVLIEESFVPGQLHRQAYLDVMCHFVRRVGQAVADRPLPADDGEEAPPGADLREFLEADIYFGRMEIGRLTELARCLVSADWERRRSLKLAGRTATKN